MQKIAAAILLLAIFGQTFSQGFFYVDYAINKAQYEKRCVNKARPMMHCNGKCLLMKRLKEQEKREQQQAPELKLAKFEVISSRSSYVFALQPLFMIDQHKYFTPNTGSPVDQPASVFHPPAFLG